MITQITSILHDSKQKCVIAIDGISASGKGTLAALIAKRFNFVHCQSSIFYRHLALRAIQYNIIHDKDAIIALSTSCYDTTDSPDLYDENVTNITSIIATIPEVRNNLYHAQRHFIETHKRVVMDGRDIGTIIAPDANLKIFVTADIDVRAKRRYNQLTGNGKIAALSDILRSLNERDKRDSERSVAPLTKAHDAILIDTTALSAEAALEELLRQVK